MVGHDLLPRGWFQENKCYIMVVGVAVLQATTFNIALMSPKIQAVGVVSYWMGLLAVLFIVIPFVVSILIPQVIVLREEARAVGKASKSYAPHILTLAVFILGFVALVLVGYFNLLMLFGMMIACSFAFILFSQGKMPAEAVDEAVNSHRRKWDDDGLLFGLDSGRRRRRR